MKPVPSGQALKDALHVLETLPQLDVAAHNFTTTFGKPVPTDQGLMNKPCYLSWRFFLLPYIEQDNLFKGLTTVLPPNFDVPGSLTQAQAEKKYPGLKKFASVRVDLYTLPRYGAKDRPETTVWRRVLVKGKPELFVVVESSDRVPWIKSGDDLVLDPDKPLPKGLGGNFAGGFFALCGDGKVRFLKKGLNKKVVVEALTTGKGVEALPFGPRAVLQKALKGLKLAGGVEEP